MITRNLPVLIPLIYLASALVLPLVGLWKKRFSFWVALVAVAADLAVSLYGLLHVIANGAMHYRLGGWVPPVGIEYVLDPLAAFMAVVIGIIALMVVVFSRWSVARELAGREVPYYAMVLLQLAGFAGIVVTGDLFNLYVFLEISALASYALVAVGEKGAPVAAFRYLILGTVGASFYLLGLWFVYMLTGSLNMADVAAILPTLGSNPALALALSLMVVGMGIKMALFPLHGWLPDAYTLAPSTSSALIAPLGTKIGAYVLIRVMLYVFSPDYVRSVLPVADVVLWLSATGIIYGSVLAMAQSELKRMLAYSSVAQIGYIGLGLGLANPWGLIGAVLHVANHAFMKATLFLVAGSYRYRLGHSDISKFDQGVRRRMPWTTAAFAVGALSMIGIPPTAGFFSKWYLAKGAVADAQWIMVAVIMLSSLLNAVYFFRVLENLYLKPAFSIEEAMGHTEHPDRDIMRLPREEARAGMLTPTLLLAAGILLLGIFNAALVGGVIQLMVPPGL